MRPLISLGMLVALAGCHDEVSTAADTGSDDTTTTTGTSDPTTALTTAPADADSSSTQPPGSSSESESSSAGPSCPNNAPPAAPTIVEPTAARIDVLAETLTMTASVFADPDVDDAVGPLAFEIWSLEDGDPDARVWSAEVENTASVTLADGAFDPDFVAGVEPWTDYLVRARYSDAHAECSAWGEWSEFLGFRTDDGSTALFDESIVRDFYLEIPPESWGPINAQAYPPGCVPHVRDYYTGTLRHEGEVFEGVGIKIKGGCGSSRSLDGKASFKVNLEWDDPAVAGCPEERRLMGEKSFSFHNGVQDNTTSHERLGYALFREFDIPAARAASVRIFVNDELWGLYTHVETIDRRFLSRWFDSKEGMLYEGTYWCDLVQENIGPSDEDDSYCLTREFSPDACSSSEPGADPMDYSLLHELIGSIDALPTDGFYPEVEGFFDFDRFLTTWAIESALSHWDNYAFGIRNNYRVYHDPSAANWTLISSGIDQTFVEDQDPFAAAGVLAVRCLEEEDCASAYAARLVEVTDAFAAFGYEDRRATIFEQLSPYVQEDPRREYSFNTFVGQHDYLASFIEQRPDRMLQWLAAYGF